MHLWQLTIASCKLKEICESSGVNADQDMAEFINKNKDAAFYSGKIHSAQFFITKILPVQEAKVKSILNEDCDALDIEEIAFGEDMPR